MITVWKYKLAPVVRQTIDVSSPRRPLHVALQHGELMLWCEVDDQAATVPLTLEIVGTGNEVPSGGVYIGTVMTDGGLFVWHIYEVAA